MEEMKRNSNEKYDNHSKEFYNKLHKAVLKVVNITKEELEKLPIDQYDFIVNSTSTNLAYIKSKNRNLGNLLNLVNRLLDSIDYHNNDKNENKSTESIANPKNKTNDYRD